MQGIIQRVLSSGEAFPCAVRTVSSMIRALKTQRIDLLKIDVEGAEMDVLAGIEEEHWPAIRMISMEVAPANKVGLSELCDRLRGLGFLQVAIEGVLDKENPVDERGPCTLYAVRAPGFPNGSRNWVQALPSRFNGRVDKTGQVHREDISQECMK